MAANGYEELGHRIAVLRALRHLSQEALAQRIGVKRGSVAAWEVGKAGPGRDTLPRVADALGVSVDALLGRAPADGPPSLPMRAAERFRAAREARGLSVAEVVRPLGITTTAVERLETGALPDASLLAILAARVGVSLDALFADDPPAANGFANLRVDGMGGDHGGGAPHGAIREESPPFQGGGYAMDTPTGPVDWPGIVHALIASLQAQQEIERRRIEEVEAPTARASEIRAQNESATRKQLDRAMEMLAQQYAPGRGEAAAQERSS